MPGTSRLHWTRFAVRKTFYRHRNLSRDKAVAPVQTARAEKCMPQLAFPTGNSILCAARSRGGIALRRIICSGAPDPARNGSRHKLRALVLGRRPPEVLRARTLQDLLSSRGSASYSTSDRRGLNLLRRRVRPRFARCLACTICRRFHQRRDSYVRPSRTVKPVACRPWVVDSVIAPNNRFVQMVEARCQCIDRLP
jgi:hypothetical protein